MRFRMVACDIDGTILDDNECLNERTASALRSCIARGMIVTLVTARRPKSAIPIARRIDPDITLICSDGAMILDLGSGRLLHSFPMPKDAALRLVDRLHARGYAAFVSRPILDDPHVFYQLASEDPVALDYIRRLGTQALCVSSLEKAMTWEPTRVSAHGDEAGLMAVAGELKGELTAHVIHDPYQGGHWIHAVSSGCDKAAALDLLARRLAVAPGEVVAFGDNYNDAPMLNYAGLGVAMGNAVAALKCVADLVTARHDQGGVAQVLERLLEGADPRGPGGT